jgi:hypothetical protein
MTDPFKLRHVNQRPLQRYAGFFLLKNQVQNHYSRKATSKPLFKKSNFKSTFSLANRLCYSLSVLDKILATLRAACRATRGIATRAPPCLKKAHKAQPPQQRLLENG